MSKIELTNEACAMQKGISALQYVCTPDLVNDAKQIISGAQHYAYNAVNAALVQRNWLLGKRIAEEELRGENRAEYGAAVMKNLSAELTAEFGKGFDASNLYKFTQFYKAFPTILDSLSPKSGVLLSWTHYRILLQEINDDARLWYAKEAAEQTWSVRTLQRNISSQYYQRTLLSQKKYKTCLPSEDELRAEIETQKRMFYLQQKEQQL